MKPIVSLIFVSVFLFCQPTIAQEEKADSLDIKIGQMLMLGIGNRTATDSTDVILNAIDKGHLGGILLYEKNISKEKSAERLKMLVAKYKNATEVPLLVSIDEEGGKVNRLKPKYGFPKTVTAKYLGDVDDIDSTKHYADIVAHNLYSLGINVNYAPVLDVDDPNNPAIGKNKRSYSTSISNISKHATQVVKSHRYFKVKTVLKHFPGQGNATKDSHFDVTDVSNTWSEKELFPYIKLMYEGHADAIMTAHIVNKNLDEEKLPATLSKKIITGLLRNRLGFEGVVISDDMQMKAISDHFGFEQAIKMAIQADVDILMFSNQSFGKKSKMIVPADIIKIVKQLIASGDITTERIDTSYKRIMVFKKSLK